MCSAGEEEPGPGARRGPGHLHRYEPSSRRKQPQALLVGRPQPCPEEPRACWVCGDVGDVPGVCRSSVSPLCFPPWSPGEIISNLRDLQGLAVDATAEKEKQQSEVKHILQQKQRALSDLFKMLRDIGETRSLTHSLTHLSVQDVLMY